MAFNTYIAIQNDVDVAQFQDITNGLHDGFITQVAYVNNGITAGEHGHSFDYTGISLVIHVLVTSLPGEPTFELVFHTVSEWQIQESQFSQMLGCSILFPDKHSLLWADDISSDIAQLKHGCYVVAESMQYRKLSL